MTEGINMGRQCPCEKEELLTIYRKVENYSKALYVILKKQGDPELKTL